MNPNDLMFLTIPVALVALKLAILAFAAVLVTRNVFKSSRAFAGRGGPGGRYGKSARHPGLKETP